MFILKEKKCDFLKFFALEAHSVTQEILLFKNPLGILDIYYNSSRSKSKSYLWVADELSV